MCFDWTASGPSGDSTTKFSGPIQRPKAANLKRESGIAGCLLSMAKQVVAQTEVEVDSSRQNVAKIQKGSPQF